MTSFHQAKSVLGSLKGIAALGGATGALAYVLYAGVRRVLRKRAHASLPPGEEERQHRPLPSLGTSFVAAACAASYTEPVSAPGSGTQAAVTEVPAREAAEAAVDAEPVPTSPGGAGGPIKENEASSFVNVIRTAVAADGTVCVPPADEQVVAVDVLLEFDGPNEPSQRAGPMASLPTAAASLALPLPHGTWAGATASLPAEPVSPTAAAPCTSSDTKCSSSASAATSSSDEDSEDDWESCADALAAAEQAPPQAVSVHLSAEAKAEQAAVERHLREHGLSCFELEKELASGGFGSAALVRVPYQGLQVPAVLKVLRPAAGGSGGDLELMAALQRETVALAAGAGCPNIVQMYGYDASKRSILMEYAAGGTLADFLRTRESDRHNASREVPAEVLLGRRTVMDWQRPAAIPTRSTLMSWAEVRGLMVDLLTGLHALHSAGYSHGDLKPANCFLVLDPCAPGGRRWVLGDLGGAGKVCCKVTGEVDSVYGTLPFASQEVHAHLTQQTSKYPVTLKSDMASLALVILYACGMRGEDGRRSYLDGNRSALKDAPLGLCDLIQWLLLEDPTMRPTPAAALQHTWLQQC